MNQEAAEAPSPRPVVNGQPPIAPPADDTRTEFGPITDDARTEFGPIADDTRTQFGGAPDDTETHFAAGSDDTSTQFGQSNDALQMRDGAMRVNVAPVDLGSSERGRLTIGSAVVADRYIIEREVAGGVEADAYIGRAVLDDRMVFIKHLRGFRTDKAAVEKKALMRDRLLRIDHPNCVCLLDAEIAPDRVIEVYEYVDGVPLAKLIAQFNAIPDRDYVREMTRQMAAGVRHLHELGLAHRDLKPDNIMVCAGAAPALKISDYGTMTSVDEGGKTSFAGTRRYAPPEALRRSLLRDNDLMASDWWSVGRIVQEVVDGEHAYDRIAKHFPALVGNDDVQPIFDAILSEQERDVYGVHAGMVEWSAPDWQPLLRGLLTSKRQFRWGYSEVVEWLDGGTPQDAYDAAIDLEPYAFKGRRYDMASAARVLAQPENWQEAVRQIVEQDGIVRYIKRELQNKRVEVRLAAIYDYYDTVVKPFGEQIADDLCTALALKLVAGDAMPVTLCGQIISTQLVRKYAAEGPPKMVHALLSDGFIERVSTLDRAVGTELQDMAREVSAMRDLVTSWRPYDAEYLADQMVRIRYADPAEIARIVDTAREKFDSTSIKVLNAVFVKPTCSERELAALAFVLQSAASWKFVSKIEVGRGNAEAVAARAKVLSTAYGWAVVREYHGFGSVLFNKWWVFAITGLVAGGAFYLFDAIALPILAVILRKTLGQYLVDQVGAGAWFKGKNAKSVYTTHIVDALGKDAPINLISQELDDCNRQLSAYAAQGIAVNPQWKGSPKFGSLAVMGMLICVFVPLPLTLFVSGLESFLHFMHL